MIKILMPGGNSMIRRRLGKIVEKEKKGIRIKVHLIHHQLVTIKMEWP